MVPQQIAMIILSWSQPNLIFPYHWSSPSSIDRGIRVFRDQFTGLCLGSIAQNWKICRDVRNLWKTVQKDGSSCHLNWKQPLAPTFFQNWWQWKTLAALLKDGKTHMTLTTKFPTRMAWFQFPPTACLNLWIDFSNWEQIPSLSGWCIWVLKWFQIPNKDWKWHNLSQFLALTSGSGESMN